MTTTIQKWGNSQGIRIPKVLLDAVQWRENEQLVLNIDKNKIIELFSDFEGGYEPVDIDWGQPMGDEVW